MSEEKKKKGWLGRLFGKDEEAPKPEDAPDVVPEPEPHAPVPAVEAGPIAEAAPEGVIEQLEDREAMAEQAEQAEEIAHQRAEPVPPVEEPKVGWLARMRDGLSKSSGRLTQGIADIFTKRKLDDDALEELEDLLITADLGVATAGRVTQLLAKSRFGEDISPEEVRTALADEIAKVLARAAKPLVLDPARKPHVILVVGVNGSGKTTTIGKMAKSFRDEGKSVTLAAGDTFRAAAVEQLKVWGDRTGAPVIARDTGADAAALAYDAFKEAEARQDDVLLIDTAGRLQNKQHLMEELRKVIRVLRKHDESAPHSVLLVLDATVGQNAHSQVEIFKEMTDVTGLVVTKLDGTAKGGVVVALCDKFDLPVHFIGVGESAEDMRPFQPEQFARALVGLESHRGEA